MSEFEEWRDFISKMTEVVLMSQTQAAPETPAATSRKPASHQPQAKSPTTAREPTEGSENEPIWVASLANALHKGMAAASAASAARSRVAFIDEADSLDKYSGQEELLPVKSWTRSVEELARVCDWNEYETYFAAKRALTAAAADWIQTRGDLRSWNALKKELESTFHRELDAYQVLESLQKTRAKKGEPLVLYVHRMRRIASQAKVPEKLTVRCIVQGIPGDPFDKLGLHACNSFDELKDALVAYERARSEWKNVLDKVRSTALLTVKTFGIAVLIGLTMFVSLDI